MELFVEQSFIVYVLTGRRVYHWHKQSWELKQGSCAFIKKGALIAERPNNEQWCVLAFFIPDEFLIDVARTNHPGFSSSTHLSQPVEPVLPLNVNEISESFFSSMLPYFNLSPPPPENLVELKFRELVLSLLANSENELFASYVRNLKEENDVSLLQIMHNNFSFRLSVEDYAKLSCKSLSTFKRAFKKQFNESPRRWITKKRLTLAKDLLETTDLSVGDISMECGFENSNHFSRLFKENTGESPVTFRRKSRLLPAEN